MPISVATGLTVGDLNTGTGYMFLFFGWGCLIWQPLAQKYGKRPVYLLSVLGTTVCSFPFSQWDKKVDQNLGNDDLGTTCQDKRPMDCQ